MTDTRLWKSDLGNKYINPVIFADYSDPDVIRVGDTYYMTASSFNYTPGLPILTSQDLVSWELKNYALENIPGEQFKHPLHSKGVWAPAIRFHEGYFYIYYGMPDEGIFMVKAKNPLKKWDEPVCVLEGKGLIDPCPWWDKDGKAYVVHAYAKSRIGFKSILGLFEMSSDGTKAITEDHFIFDGQETQITIEGPKVYKRNGYFYIFAPAGGVKTGWQTVLRAKDIHGPFEERIVMAQGNAKTNGPHQGAWVEAKKGESWFIHFQDKGLYGRVTHLQPMRWVDDWPIIGIADSDAICGEPVDEYKKPSVDITTKKTSTYLEASDDFSLSLDKVARRKLKGEPKLGLQWQWTGNHYDSFYSLLEREGLLTLKAINPNKIEAPTIFTLPNVLTQKIITPYFVSTTRMAFSQMQNNEICGMSLMGGNYAHIAVWMHDDKKEVIFTEGGENSEGKITENRKAICEIPPYVNSIMFSISLSLKDEENTVDPIRISGSDLKCEFSYALPESMITKVETDFMPVDHTWVGAKIGLFAYATDCMEHQGEAVFDFIGVDAL